VLSGYTDDVESPTRAGGILIRWPSELIRTGPAPRFVEGDESSAGTGPA
jgi:hypothetical protein